MKLHRFFCEFDPAAEKIRLADADHVNQIKNVLRLKAGSELVLFDGKLNEALAKIGEIGKDFVDLEIIGVTKNTNEPTREVILYCAILKKENFELVAQKAVEIGMSRIVPLLTKRTIKLNINRERLIKIIQEAAEQSGRGSIPVLSESMEFGEAIKEAAKNDLNILLDQGGESFKSPTKSIKQVGIFIGPEGGWEENEIEMAKGASFKLANLGKLTLRAETAAIVASYLYVQA